MITRIKPQVKPSRLYTPQETADVLEVDIATVRRWKAKGDLKPYITKPRPRYRGYDILAYWNGYFKLELEVEKRNRKYEEREQKKFQKRMFKDIKCESEKRKNYLLNNIKF